MKVAEDLRLRKSRRSRPKIYQVSDYPVCEYLNGIGRVEIFWVEKQRLDNANKFLLVELDCFSLICPTRLRISEKLIIFLPFFWKMANNNDFKRRLFQEPSFVFLLLRKIHVKIQIHSTSTLTFLATNLVSSLVEIHMSLAI